MRWLFAALTLVGAASVSAQPVDPLTATIGRADAERFAALFRETGGEPTAQQLEKRYLQPGTRAIEVFTPGRIENAEHLAATIAANPDDYVRAVETCLPWVADLDGELRAAYLGLTGLLPEQPLPEIAVVFGAENSGGTSGERIQVLGLEVLCRLAPTQDAFAAMLRRFFVHETVHTFQQVEDAQWTGDLFLTSTLTEGTADYLTSVVTGRIPDPERDAWAREHESYVFEQFAADLALSRDASQPEAARDAAFRRWFANAGNPPEGWPSELGYWVGMRIAAGYVTRARDPHAAIRKLLAFGDSDAVLEASGLKDDVFSRGS